MSTSLTFGSAHGPCAWRDQDELADAFGVPGRALSRDVSPSGVCQQVHGVEGELLAQRLDVLHATWSAHVCAELVIACHNDGSWRWTPTRGGPLAPTPYR